MSWQNIIHNRMRSFLTALGIVIGVMAIISLITIVGAATDEMMAQFSELGANKLIVMATGTPLKRGLTANEISRLGQIEGIAGASPNFSFNTNAVRDLKLEKDVATEGRNEVFLYQNPKLVSRGRPLTIMDMESKNRVCVINPELQEIIFPAEDPLGQALQINGQSFTVVGVTDRDATPDLASAMQVRRGSKGKAIIPYPVAMSMTGTNSVSNLELFVSDMGQIDRITADVALVLNESFNYKENSFFILNMENVMEMMNTMLSMMTMMLVGIASIALLVGGIGIMNMMLVSVTERTTEIGLRKALGAEPRQIQVQFLIESIFLSLLGGTIGIALGLATSAVVIRLLDITFTVNVNAIIIGFGFSTAVGVVFGWAPARRASRLNPIDALRSL
jgi:putative ABC transport system permease protein